MNESETQQLNAWFPKLVDSFKVESDRGVVLVVSTMMEVELDKHIEKRLIPPPKAEADIVSRSIKNFAAKIDFAYRIGIITGREHSVYHQLRKLRNICAHEIDEQNFDKPLFQQRMKNIVDSSDFLWSTLAALALDESSGKKINSSGELVSKLGWRLSFELFFALVIVHKRVSIARVVPIMPLHNTPGSS